MNYRFLLSLLNITLFAGMASLHAADHALVYEEKKLALTIEIPEPESDEQLSRQIPPPVPLTRSSHRSRPIKRKKRRKESQTMSAFSNNPAADSASADVVRSSSDSSLHNSLAFPMLELTSERGPVLPPIEAEQDESPPRQDNPAVFSLESYTASNASTPSSENKVSASGSEENSYSIMTALKAAWSYFWSSSGSAQ